MKTTVINITGGKQLGTDYDVYIGRHNPMRRLKQSPFANPFVVGRHCWTRQEALEKYAAYIALRLSLEPALREQLYALQGKRLGCWCKPELCHGDILVDLIDNALPYSAECAPPALNSARSKNKKNKKNVKNKRVTQGVT